MRAKFLFLFSCCALTFGVLKYEVGLTPAPIYTTATAHISPGVGNIIIPHFKLPDLNQRIVQPIDKNQKITLIHFWASWCAPCIKELPELVKFAQQEAEKVNIIAISLDENHADIKPFLQRLLGNTNQPHITWLWDENKSLSEDTLGIYKLPETLLINQNRVLQHKFVGAVNWLDPQIKNQVFMPPFKL